MFVISTVAFAAPKPHWFEISTTGAKAFIDDGRLIDEDGYNGFRARIEFDPPITANDITFTTEFLVVEVDCHQHLTRVKRTSFIEANGTEHPADNAWRTVGKPPAIDIVEAVKARVCFTVST